MTQEERLDYLIHYLLSEDKQYQDLSVPNNETDKKRLLRSLMNVRPPKKISQDFLKIQDLYLQEELKKKSITSIEDLIPKNPQIYVWKGDITSLKVDAIVNAANSALLASCYRSCLELANAHQLKSIAFCCISTGEFHFPNDIAGEIAVHTVKNYLEETNSKIEVVFNVFKEEDYQIYKQLLG